MKKRMNSKSFSFESLEKRLTMAGNISASLSGSTLNLTGDDLANEVSISGTGIPGQVLISGLNGTTINGSAAPLLRTGITSSIIAKLKAGDDNIDVRNIVIGQDLIIEGNQGRDTVFVGNARIGDDLLIYTHENNDYITICNIEVAPPEDPELPPEETASLISNGGFQFEGIASGVYVGDQFEIDAGAGNNEVEVCYTQINGNAFITTGGNNDYVSLYYVAFNKNLNVITNGGSDELYSSFVCIKGDLLIDTARGHDEIYIYAAIHNGQVNIFTGVDNDRVYVGDGRNALAAIEEAPVESYANVTNEKNFYLDTNAGYDVVGIFDMLTKGNVSIFTGSENDEFFSGDMINYKDVLIDLGSGNDYYTSYYSSTGGNFLLLGGSGIDAVFSNYDGVNKTFTIDLGSENDTATIGYGSFTDLIVRAGSGDDIVYIFDTLVVKKATFDGGAGKDRLDRFGANSFGSQSVVGFEYLTAVGPV